MHYPEGSALPYPMTAILRAHILSARAPQLRFVVRGTRGTYIKYGVDNQEDQLKAMQSPEGIFAAGFGAEPEQLWGTLEHITDDETTITKKV